MGVHPLAAVVGSAVVPSESAAKLACEFVRVAFALELPLETERVASGILDASRDRLAD